MNHAATSANWLSRVDWDREGRGRSFDFQASTDRIIEAIHSVSKRRGGDLRLVKCSSERMDGSYVVRCRLADVAELTLGDPWKNFVYSMTLSPNMPPAVAAVDWPATFSLNGLISLHHPVPSRQRKVPPLSSLGIVARVRHTRTNEVRHHAEYEQLYESLKRAVKRLSEIDTV